jgi:hypothetical protein
MQLMLLGEFRQGKPFAEGFEDDFGFEFRREFATCLLHGDCWVFGYSNLTSCPVFGEYFITIVHITV